MSAQAIVPDVRTLPCTALDWQGHSDEARQRREAALQCWPCPVRVACIEGALERKERHGVWGGRDLETEYRERTSDASPCGTAHGYRRHRRRGEGPCEACVLWWRSPNG